MSEAKIIDGKAYAADLRGRVSAAVAALERDHGLTPGLAVVLVGENPASHVYVRNKNPLLPWRPKGPERQWSRIPWAIFQRR